MKRKWPSHIVKTTSIHISFLTFPQCSCTNDGAFAACCGLFRSPFLPAAAVCSSPSFWSICTIDSTFIHSSQSGCIFWVRFWACWLRVFFLASPLWYHVLDRINLMHSFQATQIFCVCINTLCSRAVASFFPPCGFGRFIQFHSCSCRTIHLHGPAPSIFFLASRMVCPHNTLKIRPRLTSTPLARPSASVSVDSAAGQVVCHATSRLVKPYRRCPSVVPFVQFALTVGWSARHIAAVSQTHQVFASRRYPSPSGDLSGDPFFCSCFCPFIYKASATTYHPHRCSIVALFVVIRHPSGNLFPRLRPPLTYLRSICRCIPPCQRFLLRHHLLPFRYPSFPVGRSSDPNSSSIVGRKLCPNFTHFPILFRRSGTDPALLVPVSDFDHDLVRVRIGLYSFCFNVATNVTLFSEFVLIINKSHRSTLGFLLTISHSLNLCQCNVLPTPDWYTQCSYTNRNK